MEAGNLIKTTGKHRMMLARGLAMDLCRGYAAWTWGDLLSCFFLRQVLWYSFLPSLSVSWSFSILRPQKAQCFLGELQCPCMASSLSGMLLPIWSSILRRKSIVCCFFGLRFLTREICPWQHSPRRFIVRYISNYEESLAFWWDENRDTSQADRLSCDGRMRPSWMFENEEASHFSPPRHVAG